MSLYGMMRTSVSGMAAQANRLATVADNIANVGTTGYKRSTIEFQTQILDANTGNYNSGSVRSVIRTNVDQQGALRTSTSPTDLAISGDGFFIVENGGGTEQFLTRAGSFQVDSEGNLVNPAGNYLLGYDIRGTGLAPVANGFAGLSRINVGLSELRAVPTTEAVLLPNLPDGAPITAAGDLPSANSATADFAGKSSMVAYDPLGNEVTIDVYFAKTADDTWEYAVYDRAEATNGSFPYGSGPLSSGSISFDPLTGQVAGGGTTQAAFTLPGGNDIVLDMTGISQLGTDYVVNAASADGSAPTALERVEVASDGVVYGIYQNAYAEPIYQLALANVPSADNLRPLPGNNYSVSVQSGDVLVGTPGGEGYGEIAAGALEESNVDMATELTIMIEAQRSYTANSKVFQTGSDLMDVLVNLKR